MLTKLLEEAVKDEAAGKFSIPALNLCKPVLVFASHKHHDHYTDSKH